MLILFNGTKAKYLWIRSVFTVQSFCWTTCSVPV